MTDQEGPYQSERANEFYADVTENYEALPLTQQVLLEEICRLLDDIEFVTDQIGREGRVATNPDSGAVKPSPHVQDLARMRNQLGALLVRLDLDGKPDPAKRPRRR